MTPECDVGNSTFSSWTLSWPLLRLAFHYNHVLSRKGHRVVNGNFLSQEWKRYLGEVRINRDDKIAVFSCETFVLDEEKAQKFCFHYVTRSVLGTTNTTTVFCMPASNQGRKLFYYSGYLLYKPTLLLQKLEYLKKLLGFFKIY